MHSFQNFPYTYDACCLALVSILHYRKILCNFPLFNNFLQNLCLFWWFAKVTKYFFQCGVYSFHSILMNFICIMDKAIVSPIVSPNLDLKKRQWISTLPPLKSTKSMIEYMQYNGGYIPNWMSVNTNGNCICNICSAYANFVPNKNTKKTLWVSTMGPGFSLDTRKNRQIKNASC